MVHGTRGKFNYNTDNNLHTSLEISKTLKMEENSKQKGFYFHLERENVDKVIILCIKIDSAAAQVHS